MIDSLIGLIAVVLAILGVVVVAGLQWFVVRWDRAVDSWFLPKSRQGGPSEAGASETSDREIRTGDLRVLRSIAADPWWGPESEQEGATQRWLAQQRLIADTPTGLRLTPAGQRALSSPDSAS